MSANSHQQMPEPFPSCPRKPANGDALTLLTSISVFLFGSLALTTPSGYSWGPAFLLILALVSYALPQRPELPGKSCLLLAAIFSLFFISALATALIHDQGFRTLDRPSRFIFALLILPLLLKYPPRPAFLWAGIALGASLTGLWASKQVFFDGLSRAHGDTQAIQFGNIALLLGSLSLVGFLWASHQRKITAMLKVLALVGFVGGITASLLSGSRGGWITLPINAFICLIILRPRITKASIFIGMVVTSLLVTLFNFSSDTRVHQRAHQAITEVQDYFDSDNASTSVGVRLEMWRAAIVLGAQRPIVGWGEHEVEIQKQRLVSEAGLDPHILKFRHAHNDFLDSWQKRGGVGVISLALLYFVPLILFFRKSKRCLPSEQPFAIAGVILCTSYLCFSLTQAFFEHNSGVMVYAFMLLILWVLATTEEEKNQYEFHPQ